MNWRLFGSCHKPAKSLARSAWCFVTPELDSSQSWLQANLVCCGSSKQWTLAGAQEPSFSGKARIALSYRRVETKNPRPTCVVCRRASIQTLILTQASIHTLIKWRVHLFIHWSQHIFIHWSNDTCTYSYIDHSTYSYIDQMTHVPIQTLMDSVFRRSATHIQTLLNIEHLLRYRNMCFWHILRYCNMWFRHILWYCNRCSSGLFRFLQS